MKKILFYTLLLTVTTMLFAGCKKGEYPGGVVSPIIAITDVRALYKGADVTLSKENMDGAHQMVGVVVSDHAGGNMPAGLLIMQNNRRFRLRGIAIPLGNDAANYVPGDSLIINVEGGVLKRVDGMLQLTNIATSKVTKVAHLTTLLARKGTTKQINDNPSDFESTLTAILKAGFNPLPVSTDTYAGDKIVNDGFSEITLRTEASAAFANSALPASASFFGIIFNTIGPDGNLVPHQRLRVESDAKSLGSSVIISPMVITGFLADPIGTDANYEYVQFLATRDINFATEKFSVLTTNNAGATLPQGFPVKGWATGGARTYKFEITSGSVTKGTYFYVGGTGKKINGSASTSITTSNWPKSINYSTTASPKFNSVEPLIVGTATTNLLANSGNAAGVAVFAGLEITANSKPLDVIFFGTNGNLYDPSVQAGYRVSMNDYYDDKDFISGADQPFYRQGTNTLAITYPVANNWAMLGGEYNAVVGRWSVLRFTTNLPLTNASQLVEIEGTGATKLK